MNILAKIRMHMKILRQEDEYKKLSKERQERIERQHQEEIDRLSKKRSYDEQREMDRRVRIGDIILKRAELCIAEHGSHKIRNNESQKWYYCERPREPHKFGTGMPPIMFDDIRGIRMTRCQRCGVLTRNAYDNDDNCDPHQIGATCDCEVCRSFVGSDVDWGDGGKICDLPDDIL